MAKDIEHLNEDYLDDTLQRVADINDLRKQWKEALKSFVSQSITRIITPKQEEVLKQHYDNLVKEDVTYATYKKSFNFICRFMGLNNNDLIIRTIKFGNDRKDKEKRVIIVDYCKGRVKVKIPRGLSLIHVAPAPDITDLRPSFRNKKRGTYMYASKRAFFTISKDIKANKASLEGQKLYRYRTKKDYEYAYIDPACADFSSRAVYIDTNNTIPVERYDKFITKLMNKISSVTNKDKKEEPEKKVNKESVIMDGVYEDFNLEEYMQDLAMQALEEATYKELINHLKNWKASNEGTVRPVYKSTTVTDTDYETFKDLLNTMHQADTFAEYKKAFDKFCSMCHIVPKGTIIYKHDLRKGKEPNHNYIEVIYSYNIKKIDIPENAALYHMSKVKGIKELQPFFRGKAARGFLYSSPRVYLTLNKTMLKFFADYKINEKMYKYVVTTPIKQAYVDPLVPGAINRAIYVETNKPISVKPLKEVERDKKAQMEAQKKAVEEFATEFGLEVVKEETSGNFLDQPLFMNDTFLEYLTNDIEHAKSFVIEEYNKGASYAEDCGKIVSIYENCYQFRELIRESYDVLAKYDTTTQENRLMLISQMKSLASIAEAVFLFSNNKLSKDGLISNLKENMEFQTKLYQHQAVDSFTEMNTIEEAVIDQYASVFESALI